MPVWVWLTLAKEIKLMNKENGYVHADLETYPVVGFLPVDNMVFAYAPDEDTLVCHCTSRAPGAEKGDKRTPLVLTFDFTDSGVRTIPNNHEHNSLLAHASTLCVRATLNKEREAAPEATDFEYAINSDSDGFFYSEATERKPKVKLEDMSAEDLRAEIERRKAARKRQEEKEDAMLAAL